MERTTQDRPTDSPRKDLPIHGTLNAKTSKSRRRPAASRSGRDPGQAFLFVESGSSTKEKRRHVMRRHIESKKRQSELANDTGRQSSRGRYLPWRKKSDSEGERLLVSSLSSSKARGEASASDALSSPSNQHVVQHASRYSPNPVTILSASRKDPFETLPVDSLEEYELSDYWIDRLSYWSGQNKYMKKVVWQATIQSKLAFQAVILGYCAHYRAHVYKTPDDPLKYRYKTQVEEDINSNGETYARSDEDSLLWALGGLMLQEERFGDKRKADQHAERVVSLSHANAGTRPTLETFLLYVQYIMEPRSTCTSWEEAQILLSFLRKAERLKGEHMAPDFLAEVPQRSKIFQFESPLFQVLTSGPHPSQVPATDRQWVINKNAPTMEWSRTAILIYITSALWEYRGDRRRTARFLDHLMDIADKHNLSRFPSRETLIWLLLEESYGADLKSPGRAWYTKELLRIHKVLQAEHRFVFNEILFSYLTLNQLPLHTTSQDFADSITQLFFAT